MDFHVLELKKLQDWEVVLSEAAWRFLGARRNSSCSGKRHTFELTCTLGPMQGIRSTKILL